MDFLSTLDYFVANEGPWAILFVALFAFTMRSNATREQKYIREREQMRRVYEKKLTKIQSDVTVMLETWKIIIERELERRDNNNVR